jgi:hypothetical protein
MTWVVLGLLPGKVVIMRQGWPIPAERAEEHWAAQTAARRYSIRLMITFGYVPTSVLLAVALRHAFPALRTAAAQWLLLAIPFAASLWLIVVVAQQKRALDIGRDLRPPGSRTPAFGRAALMSRAGMAWFCIWFGGILLLLLFVAG